LKTKKLMLLVKVLEGTKMKLSEFHVNEAIPLGDLRAAAQGAAPADQAPSTAPDPKARAGASAVSKALGGQPNMKFAQAVDQAEKGKALNPQLLKALAPFAGALEKIFADPSLRTKFIAIVKQVMTKENVNEDQDSVDAVAGAITRRIMMQHTDLLSKYGPVKVMAAIDDVADFAGGDGLDEIGSSDVSIWTKQVIQDLESGHYDRMESVDEALNVKQIKKDLDSGMSVDAVIGKHANKNTSNTDEIRKIIKQHAWNNRMKKENVKEDLQADDGEYYNNADDFFGKFEADSFDREEESKDGMEVRGYIDDVNVMVFRYDSPKKTSGYGNYNDSELNEAEGEDKVDTVTMDVPLLLRIMEYAREDAHEDMDLHDVAERMIAMSKDGPLSMDDYDSIVGSVKALPAPDKVGEDSGKSKQYIEIVSVLGHTKRVPVHPLNAYKALNHYRDQPSTKSARIVSEDNVNEEYSMWKVEFPKQHAGKSVDAGSVHVKAQNTAHAHKVAAKRVGVDPAVFKTTVTKSSILPENYYTPGPETMPGAVGPQEDTNVSFNQTKRMGDASVTVSANAKDMEELHRVLKLAGIEVKGAPDAEPSVADAAVALAPHMPAEEPCGCDDAEVAIPVVSGPKPLDLKYTTDKTALINAIKDKLAQRLS
jgi:hypothetical protein